MNSCNGGYRCTKCSNIRSETMVSVSTSSRRPTRTAAKERRRKSAH
ncbi:MAG: hypothetical protein M1338_03095 [Patescibacteria group bacterium]|nr:hypothetical protein [Patescibacteria group bacterium]